MLPAWMWGQPRKGDARRHRRKQQHDAEELSPRELQPEAGDEAYLEAEERGGVANDGPPFPPADASAWNEPERDGHTPFAVSR
jgi:hypothetical protein